MEQSIIEHVEFSQDKAEDVELTGILSMEKNVLQVDDIIWDRSLYTKEENAVIVLVTLRPSIYERLFAACEEEMEERIIENYI